MVTENISKNFLPNFLVPTDSLSDRIYVNTFFLHIHWETGSHLTRFYVSGQLNRIGHFKRVNY